MRISDWSSDVCSSDLPGVVILFELPFGQHDLGVERLDRALRDGNTHEIGKGARRRPAALPPAAGLRIVAAHPDAGGDAARKAEEPAVLVARSRAGIARARAAELARAAGAGFEPGLHPLRAPRRAPPPTTPA